MEDKMAQQNIYDNEVFFEGYKKIRDNKINLAAHALLVLERGN